MASRGQAQEASVMNILRVLNAIKNEGVNVEHLKQGARDVYSFGTDRYKAVLTVEPEKWFGIEFQLRHSRISYSINTDLYNLKDSRNIEFLREIEQDIVTLLRALMQGRIRVMYGKHPQVLIPSMDSYVHLKQGRFFMTKSSLSDPGKLKDIDKFEPLRLK